MLDIRYANAYTEVLEILKNIPQEDFIKIPKEKIKLFEYYANREYVFHFNPEKTLDEQNVSKTARAIIAILFRDYWATDDERNKIKVYQNDRRRQIEVEKKQKYTTDIFKSQTNLTKEDKTVQTENNQLIKYKENIFKRILGLLKKCLGRYR